ncbi:lipoyltransferase 1, mitochondrial isoform X2 [Ischnura elegans]|uniref:lipoyltransferase 1, mitochondrial isoform X2 n=1 Tax=Ischnura elegans TaxID=197161 RepID=UPI001ED8BF90|nr:lipoyltransferase 1, mitochondrial isoform X2 [Ischnura elegans]
MAQTLIKGTLCRIGKSAFAKPLRKDIKPIIALSCHNYSSDADKGTNVVKSVLISQSSDIFTNLALEDWIYRHFDFSKHHVLLLWRNSPCVVVGRHQNPWAEANVSRLSEAGIPIARRNSGGGTVYHDGGNLNLTFFTPRGRYNRRSNLELIGRALNSEFGIRTTVSPREDILIEGDYKISGTAAKLGQPNAYHHCTLLVNVNMPNLHDSMHKEDDGIHTNATRSLPSPVRNLSEVCSGLTVDHVLAAVGREFLRSDAKNLGTGVVSRRGFQLINPAESWFPGLEKLRQEMSSWAWRFGKTPKFDVTRTFTIPRELAVGEAAMSSAEADKLKKVPVNDASPAQLTVKMEVVSGRVSDVTITIPPGFLNAAPNGGEIAVVTDLRGKRFSEEALRILDESFAVTDPSGRAGQPGQGGEKNRFVASCVRKVMQSV